MKKFIFQFLFLWICVQSAFELRATEISAQASEPQGFIENKGQVMDQFRQQRNDVLFVYKADNMKLILRKTGFIYELTRTYDNSRILTESGWVDKHPEDDGYYVDDSTVSEPVVVKFLNASAHITVEARGELPYYYNYYNSETPCTFVKLFDSVIYHNVYDGIDLLFSFHTDENGNELPEYSWIIHNGNYKDIRLGYSGFSQIYIDSAQGLYLGGRLGFIHECKPILSNGKDGSFYIEDGNKVSLKLKKTSASYTIDPTIAYGLYYGGAKDDKPDEIAWDRDSTGNDYVYITGRTTSGNNSLSIPVLSVNDVCYDDFFNQCTKCAYGGNGGVGSCQTDGVLSKFSAEGKLVWTTYYGGEWKDISFSVAPDPISDAVFIAGETESTTGIAFNSSTCLNFNDTVCASQGGLKNDAFVAKFKKDGTIIRGLYIGGSQDDEFFGLACDASGNVFLSGYTESKNGIAKGSNVFQSVYSGGGPLNGDDILIKYSNDLSTEIWGSYFGARNGQERGHSLAVDKFGNIYQSGTADGDDSGPFSNINSTEFPNVYQPCPNSAARDSVNGKNDDGMLIRWTEDGQVDWVSYYGGNGNERGRGVKTDDAGNIYWIGNTETITGTGIPTTCGIPAGGWTGGSSPSVINPAGDGSSDGKDAFVAKYAPDGSRIWGTYFGGNLNEEGRSIYVAPQGAPIYICGYTTSTDLCPTDNGNKMKGEEPPFQSVYGGNGDFYFAKLSYDAQKLLYCSYYGGLKEEGASSAGNSNWYNGTLDVNPYTGDLYFSSETGSANNIAYNVPVDNNNPHNGSFNNGDDFFLAKFTNACGPSSDAFEPNDPNGGTNYNDPNQIPVLPFPPSGSPIVINALISSATDVDYFKINIPQGVSSINISLTTLPTNYDLYLYDNTGKNLLASSKNSGNTSENIAQSVTGGGAYFVAVKGTGTFDTTNCYTLTISPSCVAPSATVSPTGVVQFCQETGGTLYAKTGPGFAYQWYKNGTAISGATNSQVSVSFSKAQADVYTVSVTSSGCTSITSTDKAANVTFVTCGSTACNSDSGYTFANSPISNFEAFMAASRDAGMINTSSHVLNNEDDKISFNGVITLDENFSFIDCDNVTFAQDAELDVNGHSLTLQGSTFDDCDGMNMWTGIKSTGTGNSTVTIQDNNGKKSHLNDAKTAVDLGSNNTTATVNIKNTGFNNNYVDINLNNCVVNGHNTIANLNTIIFGCDFENTLGSKLLHPYNTSRKNKCINAFGMLNFNIGQNGSGAGLSGNTFNGGDYGIYLNYCSAYIYRDSLVNFTKKKVGSVSTGYGIYATQSVVSGCTPPAGTYQITTGDTNANDGNIFRNSWYGIWGHNVGASVTKNSFSDDASPVQNGIYLEHSTIPISISNNTMANSQVGIQLLPDAIAGGIPVLVTGNVITLPPSGTFSSTLDGIHYSYVTSATQGAIFQNNTVVMPTGDYGLFLENANGISVINNTVELNQPTATTNEYGIRWNSVNNSSINCNNVEGASNSNSSAYPKQIAISLNGSKTNNVECNSTTNTVEGLEFLGKCKPLTINGNELNYHDYGITVGIKGTTDGVIGDQNVVSGVAPGNKYYGTDQKGTFAKYALYRNVLGNPSAITFQFLDSTDIYWAKSSGSNVPAEKIVRKVVSGSSEFNCETTCPDDGKAGMELSLPDPNTSAVNDSGEIIQVITSSGSEYPQDDALIWYEKQGLYESASDNASLRSTIPALEAFMDTASHGNIGLLTKVSELIGKIELYRSEARADLVEYNINQAQQILGQITPQRQLERNELIVDDIYLKAIATGIDTFTEAQKQQLFEISVQCPYIGGNAVYQARGFYALVNDSIKYDDISGCSSGIATQSDAAPGKNISSVASIYPNPADQSMKLEFSLPDYKKYSCIITDLSGKTLTLYSIFGKQGILDIPTGNLNAGCYSIRIMDDRQMIWVSKFLIDR